MQHGRIVPLALCLVALTGCQGVAIWGNIAAFAVSVGIFVCTLALGHGR